MTDQRTNEIAREAARLIETGRAETIGRAIRTAAEALKLGDATLPGYGLVRRHARAMSMQAMGDVAYDESVHDVWRIAEQIMTIIEEALPIVTVLLAGRAAKGHIDAGVTLHIRAYTSSPMLEIVESLIGFGYEEPRFETAETRFGRLDRIRFQEDGWEVMIVRCMPDMYNDHANDLFNGRPIIVATAEDLRKRLAAGED